LPPFGKCYAPGGNLDLEQTLVKHRHCTSSHHSWHLCRVICKSNQGLNKYRADIKYSHTMFNLKILTLTLNQPWSNIGTAYRLSIADIRAKLFVNSTRGSKDIERTRNTVIQRLILDCDLDPTLVKHRHCTSSHHTWHLCKVICKSYQGFKRYRADTKAWRTDRRTDGQIDNRAKTICLPISWGET